MLLGFLGGWVAGALGLGGGAIYNPLLLTMGVPPAVSSATGLYLVTFSKLAACFIYITYGELLVDYALWIALWSTVGSLLGIWIVQTLMKKFERQSLIVFVLFFILAVSAVATPFFGWRDVKKE